jgi:4-hydroxy-3-polyprenylbenzoate decarboxylase
MEGVGDIEKRFIIAITGASGIIYAKRLIEDILTRGYTIHFSITKRAIEILKDELGIELSIEDKDGIKRFFAQKSNLFIYHHHLDLSSPIASGSFYVDGMVVIPCSMGALGRIAHGVSTNLIERAADVILKEGRKLILVPRETPLNRIHLENMLSLIEAGATILPASPAFYQRPKTLQDIVDFIVKRILQQLGVCT